VSPSSGGWVDEVVWAGVLLFPWRRAEEVRREDEAIAALQAEVAALKQVVLLLQTVLLPGLQLSAAGTAQQAQQQQQQPQGRQIDLAPAPALGRVVGPSSPQPRHDARSPQSAAPLGAFAPEQVHR
jgi:hypothetical protein